MVIFQAVACSLYVMGFGESISALMHQDNEWVARGIAVGVVLLLLGKLTFYQRTQRFLKNI